MLKTFRENAEKMILNKDHITVALSGGADSVCLLLHLLEYSKELENSLNISAIHCNHHLRPAANDDEAFCEGLCSRLNIPLTVKHLDVYGFSGRSGKSIEESARELRYMTFLEVVSDKVATAHTLSDNAETVILNLIRGTGLKGLRGIPPIRDKKIIRPLINVTREEVEGYLTSHGEPYVTDETNFHTKFTRNKIRLEVMPKLREINPNVLRCIDNTISTLLNEDDYISGEAARLYEKLAVSEGLNADSMKELHEALRHRIIALMLKVNSLEQSHDRIIAIDKLIYSEGKINVKRNVYIQVKLGILSISRLIDDLPYENKLVIGNNIFFEKMVAITTEILEDSVVIANIHKKFTKNDADCGKIQGDVILRNRRDGDKINLIGRNFSSHLKKLLSGSVPPSERCKKAILIDDAGVIFVEGYGFAERVKITENTKEIISVSITAINPE